jgi:hypothetical protein
MWGWTVASHEELHEHLLAIPADVPPRGHGRTTEHVERYVIRDVLWTVANTTTLLGYPLSVEKGERPDFDLRAGGVSIGVEITEAIPPNLAQASEIQTKCYPNAALDASLFQWGVPRMATEQIHATLKGEGAHGPGWGFGSEKEEWASLVAEAVRFKTEKLNEATYRRQEQNWLAVYDNTPQPALDLGRATWNLTERLAAMRQEGLRFDRVFIELPIGREPSVMLMVVASRVRGLKLHRP